MKEIIEKITESSKKTFLNKHQIWILFLILLVIVGTFFISLISYGYSYNDKVLPGVKIGNISIGGMEEGELKIFLENITDKLIGEGFKFHYPTDNDEDILVVYPIMVLDDNTIEVAHIDTEKEASRLVEMGKQGGFFQKSINALFARIVGKKVVLKNVFVDEEKLLEIISSTLMDYQVLPRDAGVQIKIVDPLEYKITSSTPGIIYDYKDLTKEVIKLWSNLQTVELGIKKNNVQPEILKENVEKIENRLPYVFNSGGLQLSYTDPQTELKYNWQIDISDISDWLEVQKYEEEGKDISFVFGLNKEEVVNFLKQEVVDKVNVKARNAKFQMNEKTSKVSEFQGSRSGIELNVEKVYEDINQAIIERTWHDEPISNSIQLSIDKKEPIIKTGDVNNLGITEVLGVGISDYSRSPYNRIQNIKNAVNKLNGILIAPGEEFSTLEHTRPFTIEGGYLEELVIKGDEVKPEVGGGLCQIGTTLFRMAMNSGMEVTSRRNHSLVVFHYNDPVNGNPGTDATVYDSYPDFKFRNDTDNYVLIQTYMDVSSELLYFTLWGTSDGRKGYYSHPVVLRWIPHDEPKTVETTKLEPGEEECQSAYIGADASFVYTREFLDKEIEEIVYESHYRPLPKICLLGVEKLSECEEDDEECVEEVEVDAGEDAGEESDDKSVEMEDDIEDDIIEAQEE